MAVANSFRDPLYAQLSAQMEQKFGLPGGLLRDIVVKGERSNADQISEAGARTVFQIIPATRKAAIEKYGIDPYLSPENAAEVAARLLKESIDRNKGDVSAAVAEYHGGTDRRTWGPRTRAYVGRVTGAAPQGSTFERAKAARSEQQDAAPGIAEIFEAYQTGQLTPQQRAEFEADVAAGAIMLPPGAKLANAAAPVSVLPAGVIEAFNNPSEMSEGERAQLEKDVAEGVVALPPGAKLQRPGPRTAGDMFGMGVRGIGTALGSVADMAANTVNLPINAALAVTGQPMLPTGTARAGVEAGADVVGLATPETPDEKLANSIIEGLTGGVVTAGAGAAMSGARGVTGAVGRVLANNPVTDVVASGAATGASELARQSGAGAVGQIAAGLFGGVGGVVGSRATQRAAGMVANRYGDRTARAVTETPREVLIDEAGALTEEGREVAARAGVRPDDIAAAYDEIDIATRPPPEVPADDAYGQALFSARSRAGVGATSPEPGQALEAAGIDGARVVDIDPAFGPVIEGVAWPEARLALDALADGRARGVLSHPAVEGPIDVIYGNERGGLARIIDNGVEITDDLPTEIAGMAVRSANGRRILLQSDEAGTRARLDYDPARESWALTNYERIPAARAAGEAVADVADDLDVALSTPKTEGVGARVAAARAEGVDLTRAQATRDFGAQEQEQGLAAMATPEGQQVRDFFVRQADQISQAVERFKSAFGDTSLGATERGQIVKDALRDLRDQGKAGVTALYRQARDAAEALGERGRDLVALDTGPLLARMREIFIDEGVDEGARKALKQQAAKYGLIGENPRTIEGETTVTLRDSAGEPGGKITFTGTPQKLDVTNAEDLRKFVNSQYAKDTTGALSSLKALIDDAVEGAVQRAADGEGGSVGQAFKAARKANVEQQTTFKGGDVVQDIIAWKKGAPGAEAINPEDIFRRIFAGGPEGLTNLRKVKAVLLSKPTEASKAAWAAIQGHGIGTIFKQAVGPDGNVSGLRLNTAIKKFGPDKLKVLLAPDQFNQLMRLRRVIGDATIPLPRTTNPSGSGYAVIRFLKSVAQGLIPLGRMTPAVRDMVKGAEENMAAKAAKDVAEGVTGFTPEPAGPAKATPAGWAREFIDAMANDEILGPIIAGGASSGERP